MVEKYTKLINGKTYAAVLYSPRYGIGWSTYNKNNDLAVDKRIITWLLNNAEIDNRITDIIIDDVNEQQFKEYLESIGYNDICMTRSYAISFYPIGTILKINEFDGAESIQVIDSFSQYIVV